IATPNPLKASGSIRSSATSDDNSATDKLATRSFIESSVVTLQQLVWNRQLRRRPNQRASPHHGCVYGVLLQFANAAQSMTYGMIAVNDRATRLEPDVVLG